MTWTIRKKFQTIKDIDNVADIIQVLSKSKGMVTEISGYIELQFEDVTHPTSIHYDGEHE